MPPTLDDAVDMVTRLKPEIWKRCYTKHIDSPGNYYGNKAMSAALACCILELALGKSPVANVGCCAAIMEQYDFPLYYVPASFIEPMRRMLPPKDMKWSEVMLPYQGLAFMVPRKTLFNSDGIEIGCMGVARLQDVDYTLPGTKIVAKKMSENKLREKIKDYVPGDRITVWWSMAPDFLTVETTTIPVTCELAPLPEYLDNATEALAELHPFGYPSGELSQAMLALVANLLLAMTARPELVEQGSKTKKILKSGSRVHTPTFLGRKYETIRQGRPAVSSGGHFTELGWRCGHYKRQHFGIGRTNEKIIMIDPYLCFSKALVRENVDLAEKAV